VTSVRSASGPGGRDLIVTGLPRSGTTLVAALIDAAERCVCLSEPRRHVDLVAEAATAAGVVAALRDDFGSIRRRLAAGESVEDRRGDDGRPLDNYFGVPDSTGRRQANWSVVQRQVPGFDADWVLGVKHNALFTSVLPEIVAAGHWTVLAVVRDPADAIASWSSVDVPARHGRLPGAERFWPALADLGGRSELPVLDRQILIADRILARYRDCGVHVLRYEEVVADTGVLHRIPALMGRRLGSGFARPQPVRDAATGIRGRIAELHAAGAVDGIDFFYPISS
jgi:hypothetical protein